MYATTKEYASKIEKEAKAYEKIGIDGGLVETIPFEIEDKKWTCHEKPGTVSSP